MTNLLFFYSKCCPAVFKQSPKVLIVQCFCISPFVSERFLMSVLSFLGGLERLMFPLCLGSDPLSPHLCVSCACLPWHSPSPPPVFAHSFVSEDPTLCPSPSAAAPPPPHTISLFSLLLLWVSPPSTSHLCKGVIIMTMECGLWRLRDSFS